jgi:hypothetical protein
VSDMSDAHSSGYSIRSRKRRVTGKDRQGFVFPAGKLLRVSVFSLLFLLVAAAVPVAAHTWACETVDSGMGSVSGTSIQTDGAGNPHISYLNMTGEWSLRYANRSGSSWAKQTVDAIGNDTVTMNTRTSLALDTTGNPRIAYYNGTHHDLQYASLDGGGWTKMIADHGIRGAYPALALDSSGYPHIAYVNYNGGHPELMYAWYDGAAWHNTTAPGDHIGYYNSLVLDSSNTAHISTTNTTGLYYLTWDGVSWTSVPIDTNCEARESSIARDADGKIYISYFDYTNHQLRFADLDMGTLDTVSASYYGLGGTLSLDSMGKPHIIFRNGSTGTLMYASRKAYSSWDMETVDDTTGNVGYYPSMALDSSDRPHVSYWEYTGTILKYATVSSPGVDRIGVVRSNTTWLLDKSGNGAFGAGDLQYAFGRAGDVPVTGDWDGNGITKIGVVRGNKTWLLDASGDGAFGAGDLQYTFGKVGDMPVTGDWDGDGTTEIGVVRGNTTWLLDASGDGAFGGGDFMYTFGKAGDVPVTGAWDGNGITRIGVVRNQRTWLLDASGNGAYGAGDLQYTFGKAGDVPVTGDWTDLGITRIGVVRNGRTWLLDKSGNGAFGAGDLMYTFGKAGDRPVTGVWA